MERNFLRLHLSLIICQSSLKRSGEKLARSQRKTRSQHHRRSATSFAICDDRCRTVRAQ